MDTTVADLMVRDVLTVDPSDSIGEAAEKMNAAGVGAVVVVEDFVRIVGIVTERDLLRAVASRARAAEARVRQWMSPSPVPRRRPPASGSPRPRSRSSRRRRSRTPRR